MAPIVKRRPSESVERLEHTSSSPDPRRGDKRIRLSTTAPPASDDDPQDPSLNSGDLLVGTQAEFEALRDEPSDDETERIQTKKLDKMRREMEAHMQNNARENGIIEKVTCRNFMCHKHLTIELGPLINFIIGHNGSGKSAVLTAIQLCLGGKATSTNRGQSLKSFVKEGEENAVLIVHIKNGGESAYRPELYADSIIVERHFSKSGPSSFKIKAANGRIISTKRSELDDITDFYAFQLDNPVNVLTQDMARQFLNSSSEAEKYKFFIRGVQLEQLNNDYNLVWESLGNTEAQLVNVSENATALHEEYREAKRKYDELNKHEDLRSKVESCRRQLVWIQVENEERNLEKCERAITTADANIERAQSSATTHENAFTDANTAYEDAISSHAQLEAGIEALRDSHKEAKEDFDSIKGELMEHQAQQRPAYQSLQNAVSHVDNLQGEIQAERARLEAADDGAHASRLSQIERAEHDLAEARRQNDEHPQLRHGLQQDSINAETGLNEAQDREKSKGNEVRQAEDRLKSLRTNQGDRRKAYHPALADLERAIQQEKRWNEKPIGPIGDQVQLRNPEWSSVLERFFGNALNGFIVTNKHDQNLLSAICKRVKYFGPIYVTRPAPISTSSHEPDTSYDTVMRVLKFSNDLVRNQLIIQQSIEQVILIKDRELGQRTMWAAEGPPKNAKIALVMHDQYRGHGFRIAGSRSSQKLDPIPAWEGQPRLKTDIGAQISMQQERVSSLKEDLRVAENTTRERQQQNLRCKQAIAAHDRKTKTLRAQFQTAEDHLENLKSELEAATPQDGKLDGLKDALKEAEHDRDHYQNQYDESKNAKAEIDARANVAKAKVDEASKELESLQNQIQKARAKADKKAERRITKLREKNEALEVVKDAERNKQERVAHRDAKIAHLEDFVRQASDICARVPVEAGQTEESLQKKYTNMREQLARAERELGGSKEQLSQRAVETKAAYHRIEKHRRKLVNLEETLKRSIADRAGRWLQFRSHISSRARSQFIYLTAERGFHGRLRLDHKQKLLELHVRPEKAGRSNRGDASHGQTRTLSGGEKSYSTICLLLALWDAMGSPVRCLDEFDVFMDSVNRDYSMKLMINAARRSVGRQFILITPQAMNNIDAGPDVKIIRLSDPERGQTTLNVGE